MKRLLLISILMVGICVAATSAFSYPQVYLREVGVSPSLSGTFYFKNLGQVGGVLAGEYDFQIDWDMAGPNNPVPISGFCVEDSWSSSSFATYELISPSVLGSNYVKAAWLFETYGATNPIAAQLAIWEVVIGTSNGSLFSGDFKVVSFNATKISEANAMLTALAVANLSGFNADALYTIARNPVGQAGVHDYQNYIIPVPKHVPEPATMLLLGIGLIGLVGFGRKRLLNK